MSNRIISTSFVSSLTMLIMVPLLSSSYSLFGLRNVVSAFSIPVRRGRCPSLGSRLPPTKQRQNHHILSWGEGSCMCSDHYYPIGRPLPTSYCWKPKRRTSLFSTTKLSSTKNSEEKEKDITFMKQAIEYAKLGVGSTYPNPAVGCVLVRHDTNQVIGSGFHPKAGYPHAEVFALFEAAGHVTDGVLAAKSILTSMKKRKQQHKFSKNQERKHSQNPNGGLRNDDKDQDESEMVSTIQTLSDKYTSFVIKDSTNDSPLGHDCEEDDGPTELFGGIFESIPVTAYVTLEPCCHYGQTPPCASSLVLSKVQRVVIGVRDPNPRVNGGGDKVLTDADIPVQYMSDIDIDTYSECSKLVSGFIKRITPQPSLSSGDYYNTEDYSWVTGAMRSALRRLANIRKANETLPQLNWIGPKAKGDTIDGVDTLLESWDDPNWMEQLDSLLWENEVVLLRLNKAVGKKKLAKHLGHQIGKMVNGHVAQSIGHTILLYRPGVPPALDLDELILEYQKGQED